MKPWEDPNRFLQWFILEIEPHITSKEHPILFGGFALEEQAHQAAEKYGYIGPNYCVKQLDIREI